MTRLSFIARAAGSDPSSASTSSSSASSEEARAFLQRRVAAVGRVLALIFGGFLVMRVVATLSGDTVLGPDVDRWAAVPFLVIATTSFVALWLLCRRGQWSVSAVRAIEAVCLLTGCTAVMFMPLHVPYLVRPDYIVLMALGMIIIARAVFVPGSARYTLAIGVSLAVPLALILHRVHLGHDPADYSALADGMVREEPGRWAIRWVMINGLWWLSLVGLATATSHVIYGLRQEVRDARKLGQYTLAEKLGEGGMGAVYRASHAMLRRPAAVKLLTAGRLGSQALARFEREVQLTAVLTHPNTVRVFDYGRTPDGVFYYAMELIDGASLAEVVAVGGAMPAGRVIHVLDAVLGALAEAHAIGLIHRDIKPANVLLAEQGGMPDVVKVVDFGLVKDVAGGSPQGAIGDDATALALTQANAVAGTPHYMAPEAISAPATVDARTDLYAVGAVGYYLITGRDVFSGGNAFEVFAHHLHTAPVPPSERLGEPVPDGLEALILACLEKEPSRRPSDARTLQTALRRLAADHPWTEADGRRWWAESGDAVRAMRSRATTATEATLAVDLGRRARA
jgi:serine/threonine-protein kinase